MADAAVSDCCELGRSGMIGFNGVTNTMVQFIEHLYVVREEQILSGEQIIKGMCTSGRAIVETWRMEVSPEEIPKGLPHLTLAQVLDALSYYSDHQGEINDYIE